METQINSLQGSQKEAIITLTAQDLKPHFEKAYLAAAPDIEIKGFRKGKAPIQIIKREYGRGIENNAMEDIASAEFTNVVKMNNLAPIGQPALTDIQRQPDGGVVFTIKFETMPEFELGDYRSIELRKIIHKLTDEEVDKEINRILLERGTKEPAEQVDGEDFVVNVDFKEIDAESGFPLLGARSETTDVALNNPELNPDLRASLLNTKVGDTFRYEAIIDEKGTRKPFHTTVKSIQRMVPAELTNDFVEELTNGQFLSTEEFRSDVERQMNEQWENMSRRSMENEMLGKMIEMHDFEPPQAVVQDVMGSYLNEYKESLPDKKLPPNFNAQAFFQSMLPNAYTTAKWAVVREKIMVAEALTLTEEDWTNFAEKNARSFGIDASLFLSYIRENKEFENRLLSEKLVETLLGYAVVNEVLDTDLPPVEEHNHDHDHDHHHDDGHKH